MRILIVGASGFIGQNIVDYAESRAHDVIALCRSGHVEGFAGTCLKWAFNTPLPEMAFQDVGCAIHLAHDFNDCNGTINATLSNIRHLRAAGIKKQLFFSSYSAGSQATSFYGKTKQAIEVSLSADDDVVIVRPGLVLGEGGIYGRIRRWARRLPIIPLPDGGYGKVPIIEIRHLCSETLRIVEASTVDHEVNLFEREFRTLRQLILDCAAEVGRKPLIVSVPASLIIVGLKAASILRIPLPINVDNLEGFLANQSANHISSLYE